jgi:hypothetical protein
MCASSGSEPGTAPGSAIALAVGSGVGWKAAGAQVGAWVCRGARQRRGKNGSEPLALWAGGGGVAAGGEERLDLEKGWRDVGSAQEYES